MEPRMQVQQAGSGGGTTITLTEELVASYTYGTDTSVTHPVIPLTGAGAGKIQWSAIADDAVYHNSLAADWLREDLNSGGALWTNSVAPGFTGQFDVNPGLKVSVGCEVYSSAMNRSCLATYPVDPTVADSCALEDDGVPDQIAAGNIWGVYMDNGAPTAYRNTVTFGGLWSYVVSDSEIISVAQFAGANTSTLKIRGNNNGFNAVRGGISPDGGTTWYAFNNVMNDFIVLPSMASIETNGMHVVPYVTNRYWCSDDGTELTDANWLRLAALFTSMGPALDVKIATYMQAALPGGGGAATTQTLEWNEISIRRPLIIGHVGSAYGTVGGADISVRQTAPDTSVFENVNGLHSTFINARLQVRTGA